MTARTPRKILNLARHGKTAGDPVFDEVADWLRIAHYFGVVGKNRIYSSALFNTEDKGNLQARNRLLNRFLVAVALGQHSAIRRIADAVKRVHSRKEYVGDRDDLFPFHVPLVAPQILKLARNSIGTTTAVTPRELMQSLSELGGRPISERKARRLRNDFGLKPGKPGRPRKPKK